LFFHGKRAKMSKIRPGGNTPFWKRQSPVNPLPTLAIISKWELRTELARRVEPSNEGWLAGSKLEVLLSYGPPSLRYGAAVFTLRYGWIGWIAEP
jgi:hypothetical protein